jgi:hypothetical protein
MLVDTGIVGAAELAEFTMREQATTWGGIQHRIKIVGYQRKTASPYTDDDVAAVVTIGRLIREGVVSAHTYSELNFERFRRTAPIDTFFALDGCLISACPAPIERSKFRQTVDFAEYCAKGGKKDRKQNINVGDCNQIPFFNWLLHLNDKDVQFILQHANEISLTEFEIESFRQLDRFRFICGSLRSPENYPDAFHLWAAERNDMDVFLTMERKLPNIWAQLAKSRNAEGQLRVSVLRPADLLQLLGISEMDKIPIQAGQFYRFM